MARPSALGIRGTRSAHVQELLPLPNQSEHAELTEEGAVHARLYHDVAPVDFKRHSRRAESAWTCRIHSQKKAAPAQPELRHSRVVRGESSRRQRPRRLFDVRTLGLPSRPPRHGTARPRHLLLGHDEAEIKGYDNFDQLAAALSKEGVDLSGGEYTVLAPSNSAFDKHNAEVGTPVTADVLKYHVIEGKKSMDALNSDQKTLNGGTLTYYRKFRKNWLDYAIIGLKSEGPSKSSNWPADVQCDNGVIHAIDTVLVPGAYDGSR